MRGGPARAGGRPGSGRGPVPPQLWPPDKGEREMEAGVHFISPPTGAGERRKVASHAFVSSAGRGPCLLGNRGTGGLGASARGGSFHGVRPGRFCSRGWGSAPESWDPYPWSRFPPADGVRAVAGVPAHRWGVCRWLPRFVRPHPVVQGAAGWAAEACGLALKPRWISSEFGTFKFSSSYVSRAGRTSGRST